MERREEKYSAKTNIFFGLGISASSKKNYHTTDISLDHGAHERGVAILKSQRSAREVVKERKRTKSNTNNNGLPCP